LGEIVQVAWPVAAGVLGVTCVGMDAALLCIKVGSKRSPPIPAMMTKNTSFYVNTKLRNSIFTLRTERTEFFLCHI
jgi:hypothetical protein